MRLNLLVVTEKKSDHWNKTISYFSKRGKVFTASYQKEAYGILKKESVSVAVLDYGFSKIKPVKFLEKIKSIKPHVEVIFLAEEITLNKAIEVIKEGAYDIYEFPVNLRLLMAMIEKAVEKESLSLQKVELERKVKEKFNPGNLVGRSKALRRVMDVAGNVAPKNVSVLLSGETGTGKEMVASAIHYNSPRASKPFIKVNCGAFSKGVLESELFGHEKGSFTGAIARRLGRFELADGGTLFLDEIGDIPHSTQIRLLRVLQEREFERVGGNETIKVDVRVIAATNKDLKKLIEEGGFREDLYYRLNVVHMELPPLRERKDDIPLLVSNFIHVLNEKKGYKIKGITRDAMQIFLNYKWPGNVRELENALESAMALAEKDVVEAKYLPSFLLLTQPQQIDFYQFPQNLTLYEMEQEIIKQALGKNEGNKSKSAKMLGIGLRTLQRKIKNF